VSAKNSRVVASALTTLPPVPWILVRSPSTLEKIYVLTNPAFFYPQESPEAVEFHKANGMGGRLTLVEDIAPIVRFLCTDGTWITGQTIFANGGYTTR